MPACNATLLLHKALNCTGCSLVLKTYHPIVLQLAICYNISVTMLLTLESETTCIVYLTISGSESNSLTIGKVYLPMLLCMLNAVSERVVIPVAKWYTVMLTIGLLPGS